MLVNFIKNVLMYEINAPKTFGPYHFFCLALMVLITVLMCKFLRKMDDKAYRKMVGIVGLVAIIFEVYKLCIYSMDIDEHNVITWSFPWYLFPFQFCSSPLYVFPLVAILKDGKVRNALMTYMSTFMIFAGLAVMIYPGDCYVKTLGIDIQTMYVHGSMFVMGAFNIASGRCELSPKNMLNGIITFAVFICIAMTMNVLFYYFGPDATFNMFYISPFYVCHLPILSIIYANTPYPVFLCCYLFGFSLVASIMMALGKLALVIASKASEKEKTKKEKIFN